MNCSVTTIVGAILNLPSWITVGSFLLGLFLQITIVPPQVYRTVSNKEVSPSIATNMMQAPCSLNMITWGVMRRYHLHLPKQLSALFGYRDSLNEFEDLVTHVLYFFSVLVVWLTIYCLYVRRRGIIKEGFHPGWAVLTFPTCSSAVATLQYCGLTSQDLATPKLTFSNLSWQWFLKVYGITFSIITCIIVLSVLVGYISKCGFVTSHVVEEDVDNAPMMRSPNMSIDSSGLSESTREVGLGDETTADGVGIGDGGTPC